MTAEQRYRALGFWARMTPERLSGVIDFLKLLAPYQSVKVIVVWRKSDADFQNMTTDRHEGPPNYALAP